MDEIFDESHYFVCSGGLKPASMKSNQNIVKREDGKYYLTEYSLKCSGIDFSCKWVALLYAIVAAALALLLSCPAGWVLLAAIIGAGVGAALGAAMCGDMAAIMRVWVAIKTDAQLGEHHAVANKPGVHMICNAFSGQITYVPNVKNEFTALCLFAVNIGMTGLEGFMYAYAGRGLGMLATARFGAFFANFGANFLASYTMKGVAMRTIFAGVGATNSYYYSKTEGGSKEEITEGALNGGFFIEGAFYRLGTKATTGHGYDKEVYNTETGQYEKQTDWMAMSNDIAMPLSMGGIRAGTNNRDANINDVKAGAKNVLNEWSNPKQTAVSELNKIKEQLTKTIGAAKEFRNRLKSQQKGNGAHEKFVFRQDNNPYSSRGSRDGRLKSSIDKNGNLLPANKNGNATVQDHIRGTEPKKSDSPYTSFSEGEPGIGKKYGDNVIEVDIKRLEDNIADNKIHDIEVLRPERVQSELQKKIDLAKEKYENNPTGENLKKVKNAERDLENTVRDHEVLIKGEIPAEYIKVYPNH